MDSPSKQAKLWQGSDLFPGIDDYHNELIGSSNSSLKLGTILVKQESSVSGYFSTLEEYIKLLDDGKVSATQLSEGLQVAPWYDKENLRYIYRNQVSFHLVTQPIEAAVGDQTLANPQYGCGRLKQIYLPQFDGRHRENNRKLGLIELNESNLDHYKIPKRIQTIIKDSQLTNSEITRAQYEQINILNNAHLLKRNLFCYQKERHDLLTLMKQNTPPKVQALCSQQLDLLTKYISSYKKSIKQFEKEYGRLLSSTYDKPNNYLNKKNKALMANQPFTSVDSSLESTIDNLQKNIIHKVINSEKTLSRNTNPKNIHKNTPSIQKKQIEELQRACDIYHFCNVTNALQKETEKVERNVNAIKQLETEYSNDKLFLQQVNKQFDNLSLIKQQHKALTKKINKYETNTLMKGISNQEYQNLLLERALLENKYKDSINFLKSNGINSFSDYQHRLKVCRMKADSLAELKDSLGITLDSNSTKTLMAMKHRQNHFFKQLSLPKESKRVLDKLGLTR